MILANRSFDLLGTPSSGPRKTTRAIFSLIKYWTLKKLLRPSSILVGVASTPYKYASCDSIFGNGSINASSSLPDNP